MPDSWDFDKSKRTDRNRTDFVPVITVAFIALSVLLTFAYLTDKPGGGEFLHKLVLASSPDSAGIWDGQYHLLITSLFIHGNLIHILFNMLWFFRLGIVLEERLGSLIYAPLLLGMGVVSGACELAISGNAGIGMSGVVYGMFGLMWALRDTFPEFKMYATRENLNIFLIWGAFCFIATWTHSMAIANYAHAGGLLLGLAIGWLYARPKFKVHSIVIIAALLCISTLALTYLPWSAQWTWWKGNREYNKHHYSESVMWYMKSLNQGEDKGSLWNNIALAELGMNHYREAEIAKANADKYRKDINEPGQSEPAGKTNRLIPDTGSNSSKTERSDK